MTSKRLLQMSRVLKKIHPMHKHKCQWGVLYSITDGSVAGHHQEGAAVYNTPFSSSAQLSSLIGLNSFDSESCAPASRAQITAVKHHESSDESFLWWNFEHTVHLQASSSQLLSAGAVRAFRLTLLPRRHNHERKANDEDQHAEAQQWDGYH